MNSTLYVNNHILTWRSKEGIFHRIEGPGYICAKFHTRYMKGMLHCEDKPTIICPDGSQYLYLDDVTHRIGGPAIIHADGKEEWWEREKKDRNTQSMSKEAS